MSHVHRTFIGIDPGKKGAIAVITDGHLYEVRCLAEFSCSELLDFIEGHCGNKTFINIEKVHSRPLDGRKSVFSFGKGYGKLLAICEIAISHTPMHPIDEEGVMKVASGAIVRVPPAVWKKKVLGKGKHDKQDSINKAKELYPDVNLKRTPRCRVDDDNMAEAILIAYYGYKLWEEANNENN